MSEKRIEDEDLYEILEIDTNSSINEIKKAYRKKALKLHPDKNPDNPNAAIEFHRLSKILEILTDELAKKAYDNVLRARKEAALRHKELDSKRRKFKENLEERERNSSNFGKEKSAEDILKAEIERLRKEGSKQVEEEIALITKQIYNEQNSVEEKDDNGKYRIKINWKAAKNDPENGGYNEKLLHKFLSKYGDINALVFSPKRKGSALVEFTSRRAAEMAVELEQGLAINPLQFEWVNKPSFSRTKPTSSTIKDTDYESVVLMKLRQAEERKKLIEQMMAEDNINDS